MTGTVADPAADDPETCRRGRVCLGWYAGALAGLVAAALIAGYAAAPGRGQASDFAYARNDAALQVAATMADSFPRGY